MMKTTSIRRRLIGWIGIPILLACVLTFLIGFLFAQHEIEEVYDAQMVHNAKFILQLTQHELGDAKTMSLGMENPDLHHKYERKMGFRVWVNGQIVAKSQNVESFEGFEAAPGFSDQQIGKYHWRFFVFLDPSHKIQVEVSERYDVRSELINQLMSALIIPALLLVPVIVLLVWVGVRRSIMPLIRISNDVDRRGSDDLSPITGTNIPDEISPLIQALNRLFARLTDSFQREREFTDHAAHELRTPLAAMKTQTQVLMKKAAHMPDYKDGLENLGASINRATHLVNQLLSLARLQHETLTRDTVDLSGCLRACADDAKAQFTQKMIGLDLQVADNVMVDGNAPYIAILLRNLLDNAAKYTPAHGRVSVTLDQAGSLRIADTGAGVSDEDKKHIFERFVRADKTGQDGSGLGLSIVQWIADAHHAKITLHDNHPHGLIVDIRWKVKG